MPTTCLVPLTITGVSRCFICELAIQPSMDTAIRKLMVVPEAMHDLASASPERCLWELSTWIAYGNYFFFPSQAAADLWDTGSPRLSDVKILSATRRKSTRKSSALPLRLERLHNFCVKKAGVRQFLKQTTKSKTRTNKQPQPNKKPQKHPHKHKTTEKSHPT